MSGNHETPLQISLGWKVTIVEQSEMHHITVSETNMNFSTVIPEFSFAPFLGIWRHCEILSFEYEKKAFLGAQLKLFGSLCLFNRRI